MADFTTIVPAGVNVRPTVITLRPSSLTEVQLIKPPGPREFTLMPNHKYQSFFRPPVKRLDSLVRPLQTPLDPVVICTKKIPRPPNAFMIFANEFRKQLAQQFPSESNKSISIRLGQIWKNMTKGSKEIYYQRSRQAGRDHKEKYPGYVYNPKEARMRKALREQSRGARNPGGAPARWTNRALTMNHHRKSLASPVMLQQHPPCVDNSKGMLHEQVDRDNMLQSYPDYLDLPTYNIPSNDFPVDNQSWLPYIQQGVQQSNGPYMGRPSDNKLPVDWSTPYSSEQGNFIRASPQSSPYTMHNQQEVSSLLLNGDRGSADQPTTPCGNACLTVDTKPVIDQIICQNNDSAIIKDQEQQVKELLCSAKVISEGSPVVNGKQEDSGSTRLPGFHQAFGSTEIGRFSQPDGFFEAAVAAENERKTHEMSGSASPTFPPGSSAWTSSFYSCSKSIKSEPDLFGFQDEGESCNFMISPSQFNEPNHLYTLEDNFYHPGQQMLINQSIIKKEDPASSDEFESQDLSTVTNMGQPPVIISQNDNCCVVLESSAMDTNVKEYFSL